ncbi:MAG: hypothetical protein GY808_12815 [Gammaproteobacteria bacterium]|nr:hypothetical protein [Gammaproteobacteria bacterium]
MHKNDSKGLERLLRYCARPVFASERLQQLSNNLLIYKPDKQWKNSNGQSFAQHPMLHRALMMELLQSLIA